MLGWQPEDGSSAAAVVAELDLLLTSGRLNANATAVIVEAYDAYLAAHGAAAALKVAQQLFMAAPEFHATNLHNLTGEARPPVVAQGSGAAAAAHSDDDAGATATPPRFKAIVVLYLGGGCDSFNVLMPHGNCTANGGKDLHAEYTAARGDVAMGRDGMIAIEVPSGTQPCDTFGVHASLPTVAALFREGDAAFVANIGALIEPVDRASYYDGSATIPPQVVIPPIQRPQTTRLCTPRLTPPPIPHPPSPRRSSRTTWAPRRRTICTRRWAARRGCWGGCSTG